MYYNLKHFVCPASRTTRHGYRMSELSRSAICVHLLHSLVLASVGGPGFITQSYLRDHKTGTSSLLVQHSALKGKHWLFLKISYGSSLSYYLQNKQNKTNKQFPFCLRDKSVHLHKCCPFWVGIFIILKKKTTTFTD